MATVYVSLGSNLGDREENIEKAIRRLASIRQLTIVKQSSILETEPVDFLEQQPFLNTIIILETQLTPHDLLNMLKQAEIDLGRKKTFPKGPRSIDLDILLYNDLVLNSEDLIIPHPEIKNRTFILQHLAELEPELIDPVSGKKFKDLLY